MPDYFKPADGSLFRVVLLTCKLSFWTTGQLGRNPSLWWQYFYQGRLASEKRAFAILACGGEE